MLTHRLCNRFLFHIIVKHAPEPGMTVQRNHEKTLAVTRAPLFSVPLPTGSGVLRSAEMGITSAGMQSRMAGCGEHIRARTAR